MFWLWSFYVWLDNLKLNMFDEIMEKISLLSAKFNLNLTSKSPWIFLRARSDITLPRGYLPVNVKCFIKERDFTPDFHPSQHTSTQVIYHRICLAFYCNFTCIKALIETCIGAMAQVEFNSRYGLHCHSNSRVSRKKNWKSKMTRWETRYENWSVVSTLTYNFL